MPTNPFFNFQTAYNEQDLVENLIIEAIQIYGMEVHYVPKTLVDYDKLLGEDAQRAFMKEFPMEMYFENVDGFGGDKNFLNQMGLNIEKQATFIVAKKIFDQVVNSDGGVSPSSGFKRPDEGDLIYLPLTKDIFEISFADHEEVFYQLGKIYVWKLTCEKFRYSHEPISTGNAEIDKIATELENNNSLTNDPLSDNADIQTKIGGFLDLDTKAPF